MYPSHGTIQSQKGSQPPPPQLRPYYLVLKFSATDREEAGIIAEELVNGEAFPITDCELVAVRTWDPKPRARR